jgi:tRNA(Ile)-lysidine synthase
MDACLRAHEAIIRYDMLRAGDRVLVGVSGGADSVALLRMLHGLAAEPAVSLAVGHLNHAIRGAEADADEQFVKDLAAELALECIAERADVPAVRKREGGSLEEVARRERYAFFGRAADSARANKIALGHNRDDNAETVLQRILRGTGLRGLRGIPPKRPLRRGSDVMIIRPLIETTRREILEHLANTGCAFRNDATNDDVAYFRNRLRHVILPQLEAQCGPAVGNAIIRLAESARNQYNLIEPLARRLLDEARLDDADALLAFDRNALAGAEPELVIEALRLALEDAGVGQLTSEQSHSLLDMAVAAGTGKEMSLPGGLALRAEYDKLVLLDPPAEGGRPPGELELPFPGEADFAGWMLSVPAIGDSPGREAVAGSRDHSKETVDADRLELPLTIRTRRPGDRFRPLGAPGSRKLHDFFIDEKVPGRRRDEIPIVCDRAGIVWVAGYRIAHRVRITDKTRRAATLTMSAPAVRNG